MSKHGEKSDKVAKTGADSNVADRHQCDIAQSDSDCRMDTSLIERRIESSQEAMLIEDKGDCLMAI